MYKDIGKLTFLGIFVYIPLDFYGTPLQSFVVV